MGHPLRRIAPTALILAVALTASACQASPAPTAAAAIAPATGPAMHAKTFTPDAESTPEPSATDGLHVTNGTIVDTEEPEQFD